jgi:hypothetical protein
MNRSTFGDAESQTVRSFVITKYWTKRGARGQAPIAGLIKITPLVRDQWTRGDATWESGPMTA